MLIAMVTIFAICWLPLNSSHIAIEVYYRIIYHPYYLLFFFIAHIIGENVTLTLAAMFVCLANELLIHCVYSKASLFFFFVLFCFYSYFFRHPQQWNSSAAPLASSIIYFHLYLLPFY